VAPSSGMEDASLGPDALLEDLVAEPSAFEFFQAVRLLSRFFPERATVGRFTEPADEVAHFMASPSLAFPASEIQRLELPPTGPAQLRVNFMGLVGPLGVLPYQYTTLIAERLRVRDSALQSFFNIFEHRILALFYRAWEKSRFTVAYERDGADRVTEHLLDLIGLGLPSARGHLPVPDEALLFYAGALLPHPRSAVALEQMLEDFLRVPATVEQFVGGWYPLERSTQCALGEEVGPANQLGLGAVVGDEIWEQQGRLRVRLGPLDREQYESFLPSGAAHHTLRALVQFFTHDQFEVELQLVLAHDAVPTCRLGADGDRPASLGWATWLRTATSPRDADETVLTL
jgi:type VI secretion system protein ImpH